ncbi:MAG TPA: site-specific integrase, partial [Myxococcota bacterium]|nr:site-specific integrase [Myxococcota bacterium]
KAKATLEASGLGGGPPKTSPPSCPSLAEYLESRVIPYLEARGRAEKTMVSVRTSKKHLVRLMGDRKLSEVSPAIVDAYVSVRRKEKAKGRTIQIEFGPLLLALKLALKDGLIPALPSLHRPTADDSRPHVFLTEEQSMKLLKELPWQLEPASAMAIYTCLELGTRRGECLSRRWEDIRWNQGDYGAIHIGRRVKDGATTWNTKTRVSRTVSLTPGLKTALQEWWLRQGRPDEGWIFPSPFHPEQPLGNFKKSLKEACRRAGVPLLHPHALRHSWATRAAIAGVPKVIAMAVGGWKDPRTLEGVYQHSVSELEAQAVVKNSLGSLEMTQRSTNPKVIRMAGGRQRREAV